MRKFLVILIPIEAGPQDPGCLLRTIFGIVIWGAFFVILFSGMFSGNQNNRNSQLDNTHLSVPTSIPTLVPFGARIISNQVRTIVGVPDIEVTDFQGLQYNLKESVASEVSWSPNGSKILYRGEENSIRVVNIDGTGDHQVVHSTPGDILSFTWNDDEHVLFKHCPFDQQHQVFNCELQYSNSVSLDGRSVAPDGFTSSAVNFNDNRVSFKNHTPLNNFGRVAFGPYGFDSVECLYCHFLAFVTWNESPGQTGNLYVARDVYIKDPNPSTTSTGTYLSINGIN